MENKMNKRDGRQLGRGESLSPAHTVERKFLTVRKRTRTHAPQRGQTETRRLELYPNRGRNREPGRAAPRGGKVRRGRPAGARARTRAAGRRGSDLILT